MWLQRLFLFVYSSQEYLTRLSVNPDRQFNGQDEEGVGYGVVQRGASLVERNSPHGQANGSAATGDIGTLALQRFP